MSGRNWLFTSFDEEDYTTIASNELIKYLCYGHELTKENRKHRQGYMQLSENLRMGAVKKFFTGNPHLEIVRGTDADNHKYCSKEGDFTEFGTRTTHGGTRKGSGRRKRKYEQIAEDIDEDDEATFNKHGLAGIKEKKGLRNIKRIKTVQSKWQNKMDALELNEYQLKWLASLEGQNDRQITWVWDHDGGKGKSTFGTWLEFKRGALPLTSGKIADMGATIGGALDDGNDGEVIVMDLVRAQADYFQYGALEQIKDGKIPDPKYKSRMIRLFEPKVIVLANFAPDKTKMTSDRWLIISEN